MKVIYLALKIIWKQKFLNLFLLLVMVLSLYYLIPVFGQVSYYRASLQALGGLELNHAYYLYYNPYYSRRDSFLKDSVERKISSVDYITGYAEVYHMPSIDPEYHIVSYHDTLIENFVPEIKEGIWLDEADETGCMPAVVSADMGFPCGKQFSLGLSLDSMEKNIDCEVVGVLKQNTKVIGFSGAADNSQFTVDALLDNTEHTVILPFTEEIKRFISDKEYLLSAGGGILYTSSGTSYEEVLNDFGYAGIVTDLWDGNGRFYEQSRMVVSAMGAYFLLYFMITGVCCMCSNFILNISNQKNYAIYFLTGMSCRRYITVEITRVFLLIFTGTVVSFVFLYKSGLIQSYYENINPVLVLAGILCYSCFLFIPASAFFIFRNGKKAMADFIRNLTTEI